MTNELTIELTGKIQNTNFDEWKKDLIVQIKSTKVELTTDDDFFVATKQVKILKTAENSLRRAKQSAIEQAEDIQKLFLAIDEISEEARRTRLTLERQIKSQKHTIKEELINFGLEAVKEIISKQSPDFQLINHSKYLDSELFIGAIKGKASIEGVTKAINNLIKIIEEQISLKSEEVSNNAIKLNDLPGIYKVLFQDKMALLSLSKLELDLTINKRIASYNEDVAKRKAEKAIQELSQLEETELNPDLSIQLNHFEIAKEHEYVIAVDIFSNKEKAMAAARLIREIFTGNDAVKSIRLSRNHHS